MFGFFSKKLAFPLCRSNPGIGVRGKVTFSRGERTWAEHVNIVRLAAGVLKKHGYSVANRKTWLHHVDSGFIILPQLVGFDVLDDGSVQTVSTIQMNHPTLVPEGVFEYQHSCADTVVEAISNGLDQWVQTDFLALLDALRPEPESCSVMEMTFPAGGGVRGRVRRAVLGPVAHFRQEAPSEVEARSAEDHPFCPCCLLTNSFQAFQELIEHDAFYGVRLFAARDAEGAPQADCRVNGEDWEKGAQALREYAQTWPSAGVEFRKQYVVLHSIEKSA